MRITGTEGNIAYRTADYERWQQLDFVEGIEINTSHTNHPVADICDELKGVYPKEFKWTGWHPMCRCNATAKMSDFDAFLAKQQEYIDNGTQPDYSENKVTEMPDNFTKWVNDNEERIAGATSLPYFLADNGKLSKGKYRVQLGAIHALAESSKLDKSIKNVRKQLIRQDKEQMIILNKKGSILKVINGNNRNVQFEDNIANLMRNNIVTHNHPTGKYGKGVGRYGCSLSVYDVFEAVNNNVAQMIAEAPHYRYSITRPANGWNVDANVIKKRRIGQNGC